VTARRGRGEGSIYHDAERGRYNSNVTRAVYRHMISDTVTRAPAALDQALAAGGES
jgi:hypothetical protein